MLRGDLPSCRDSMRHQFESRYQSVDRLQSVTNDQGHLPHPQLPSTGIRKGYQLQSPIAQPATIGNHQAELHNQLLVISGWLLV